MRKFIALMALLTSFASWPTLAANNSELTDNQKRELVDIMLIRDRLSELSAIVSESPLEAKSLNENSKRFLKLKEEIDKLGKFSWYYGMLLQKKVEDGSVISGHNRFVTLRLADAFVAAAQKISEYTSLYAPGERRLKDKKLFSQINPLEMQANTLWLSAHLTIFHAFLNTYNGFYRYKGTRMLIKDLIRAFEGEAFQFYELVTIAEHTVDKKSQRQLKKSLEQYVSARREMINQNDSKEMLNLIGSIESNDTAHDIYNGVNFKIRSYKFVDFYSRLGSKIVNAISKLFGNFAGRFRFRKGYMYEHDSYREQVLSQLRPLDILNEKTPFALTDTFIPGHYGHSALYLGTEKQLKEIGMWDHPVIKPHQEEIKKGKVILEALRPGVWLNTLEEFLNIDEITVYRQESVFQNMDEVARIYKRGLDQLGKDYDFNFDVNTLDKIVCSELIFHAFGNINWPIKYVLGRATISPDNVAELAFYQSSPISFNFGDRALEKHAEESVEKNDIASKLSIEVQADGSYARNVRRCRDVHQENGDIERVCYGMMEPLEYKASNESIYDFPGTAEAF